MSSSQEAPRKPSGKNNCMKKCVFIYLFLPVFVSLEFPVFPSDFQVLYLTAALLLLFHSLVFQFHILSWISNLRFHGVNVLISTSFRDHGQKCVIWQCHSRFMVFLNTRKNTHNNWQCFSLWQYGLWSFQTGDTKLERFLPRNQHTQRKLFLNFFEIYESNKY